MYDNKDPTTPGMHW